MLLRSNNYKKGVEIKNMAAIGQRIKQRRIELGMTQEELAHKMGYASKTSINPSLYKGFSIRFVISMLLLEKKLCYSK